MNRYVIARVSSPPRTPDPSHADPTPAVPAPAALADLVELGEVDRHAFFRICFHMARSGPRRSASLEPGIARSPRAAS